MTARATTRRRAGAALLLCAGVIAAGCASGSGVQIARSDQHPSSATSPDDTTPDSTSPDDTTPITDTTDSTDTTDTTDTTDSTDTSDSSTPTTDPGPASGTVDWHACDDEDAPWQCGSIQVPMDYQHPEAAQISIALNRLPASRPSQRIGSIVVNPGGPGGSGIELAYNEGEDMPQEIRDRFDVVGFDPRGVGQSTPVTCPSDFDPNSDSLNRCIASTGKYLTFLGTPNVARDLDQVRAAIGDTKLTYLGYSYGTALGGVYADLFPDRVRAMVLDGSVDPSAGEVNTTKDFGDDFYAEQDFDSTIDIFLQLCDASKFCAAGPHAKTLLDKVEAGVRLLPTKYFAGATKVTRGDVDDLLVSAMYSLSYWPLLSVALKDAADGDASTLAAFSSYLEFGYPADMESEPNFEFANLAIRCADFAGRGNASQSCHGFPATAEPIPAITTAVGSAPIVVVGTKGDPATPWRYSGQMAQALGNAVSITWEGAGHTAFLSSSCITTMVTSYIVDLTVPADGADCPFVVGATTLTERADRVFGTLDLDVLEARLVDVLVADGDTPEIAGCVSTQLALRNNQRLIVHELLGVETPDIVGLRAVLTRNCTLGG